MSRWLVLLFVLLLPIQFAWSATSAYCQHESSAAESRHFGHHFHAHEGESKQAGGALSADPDCAACHAAGASAIAARLQSIGFVTAAAPAAAVGSPPFASALARAPDRPQWLRLV